MQYLATPFTKIHIFGIQIRLNSYNKILLPKHLAIFNNLIRWNPISIHCNFVYSDM